MHSLLALLLFVSVIVGTYHGIRIGGFMKNSPDEEIANTGLIVQVFSITLGWVGWIITLYFLEKFSKRINLEECKRDLIGCLLVGITVFAISFFV